LGEERIVTDGVLASWKDGPVKQAIVEFVTSATEEGPGFVAGADRIATFDKDTAFLVGAATQDPEVVATMLKALATALPADPQSVQR
jgi:hypothetical protein